MFCRFHDDLKTLEQIPILSTLFENQDFQTDSEQQEQQQSEEVNNESVEGVDNTSKKNMSLYEWISAADNGNSIDKLFEHCHYGLTQVLKIKIIEHLQKV